jgi:hypothetical protein
VVPALPAAVVLALAQLAAAPVLVPVRTPAPPSIDGDLSDSVWALAAATSAFTQQFPVESTAPSERTTLKVLYDDEAIYIAFDLEQKTVPIVQRMARRDRDVESDSVTIDIDSRAQGKTAFELTVNAAGVLRDGIRSNDVIDSNDRFSSGWDENWDARTVVREGGWSAEIRIPLRVLRFSSGGGIQTWGFQARRYTSMRQETDQWALVPRNVASEVSMYGHLQELRMRPRADLEVRPFVLGWLRRRDKTAVTLDSGLSPAASAGLDLRWHLTPDLTLDGTVNPDFTQVERALSQLIELRVLLSRKAAVLRRGRGDIRSTGAALLRALVPAPLHASHRAPSGRAVTPTDAGVCRSAGHAPGALDHPRRDEARRSPRPELVGGRDVGGDRGEQSRRARQQRRATNAARGPHDRVPGAAFEARFRGRKGPYRLPRNRRCARREDERISELCAARRLGIAGSLSHGRGAHTRIALHA